MTIEELEKELKQGILQSVYLFYGEETFLLETMLKKIKTNFGELKQGINYIKIEDTNVGELIADLDTPAFGYEKKIVIARNTGLFKKEGKKKSAQVNVDLQVKIAKYIEENIKILQETVVLIFVEQEIEKNEIYKVIEKNGVVCNFEELKPMQIIQRLKSISKAYKVEAEESVLQYLIECSGTNMQNLINEIRKLIEYAGENGKIEKQNIDLMCTKQMDSVIFELTDNLGKKNTQKAIEVLKDLQYQKEPLQKILITLYNHFKKLYMVKLAIKWNKDIGKSLNLKPNQTFLVGKYKMQAGYFKEIELRKIIEEFINLDRNYKIGNIDLEIGMESILCNYC